MKLTTNSTKIIRILLTIATLSCVGSTASWAESQRAPLAKGDRAPFEGILISQQDLAALIGQLEREKSQLAAKLEQQQRVSKLEADAAEQRCEARMDSAEAYLNACQTARNQERAVYNDAIHKNDPWWRSPALMMAFGFAGAVGVCAAAR